jgi:putative sterol carrier protein
MAKFLSEGWIDEVRTALNASDDVRDATKEVAVTIQQVVRRDEDATSYWVRIADGTIDGGIGDASGADVTITQDYETAVAITTGEVNLQAAFMQGNLKVTGNMAKLLQNQYAIQALFPVLASVPTEY